MPSNEIQSAVEMRIRTDYASGCILAEDPFTGSPTRLAIAGSELTLSMLNSVGGRDEDAYELGQSWGQLFYDSLTRMMDSAKMITVRTPKDFLKEEFVEHLNAQFSYAGMGQFRIIEGNRFYAVDVRNAVAKEWTGGGTAIRMLMAGFFAELFSRLADKPLSCLFLDDDGMRWRFALSKPEVIEEIRKLMTDGKSASDICVFYKNEHFT